MKKNGKHKNLALTMAIIIMLSGAFGVQAEESSIVSQESSVESSVEASAESSVQESSEEGSETTEAESVDNNAQDEEKNTLESTLMESEDTTPESETVEDQEESGSIAEEIELLDGQESEESSEAISPETIPVIQYQTHVQSYDWQDWVQDGAIGGTTGLAKRMEAIKIQIQGTELSGSVEYRSHVQSYGWMDWVSDGALSGTTGIAKRMEGIQIRLTGELAERYDIYYRVHSQTFGWMGWAKNGEAAGSAGYEKRVEAIQIVLVQKDGEAPGEVSGAFKENLKITYQTHVQTYGWQGKVSNGKTAGTTGEAKRLEAVQIKLENNTLVSGGVEYRVHCQTYDWMDWTSDWDIAGTTGEAKRLEAIQVRLTGEMAEKYDVYYRVHCQTFGWTGWACNGESAGSEGYAKRLEAIEIQLVEKGGAAPGPTDHAFYKVHFWGIDVSSWQGSVNWAKAKADGVDFAMLRITQLNTDGTDQRLMKDRHLDDNVRGALANGIPVGGYVYIYSSTPEEAREDAKYALSLIEDYNFSYPIAFDLEEEEHMTTAAKLNNMAMAKAFCEVFEEAGYTTCVYGSPSKLRDVFDYDEIADSYDIWLARYRWSEEVMDFNDESVRDLVYDTGYEGGNWTGLSNVQMWQFTSTGRVDGVAGNVDLDLCYKVY